MDEYDDDMVDWEDGDQDNDDEDIVWEEDGGDGDGLGGDGCSDGDEDGHEGAREGRRESLEFDLDGATDDDEPEERRWLGDNGEIVVELPRGGEEDAGDDGSDSGGGKGGTLEDGGESRTTGKGKGKEKAKARRFTAEETRLALDVHKAHLACLVARCSMVSRWAGDPTVQAAMVSCLPSHLLSKESMIRGGGGRFREGPVSREREKRGDSEEGERNKEVRGKLTLADLVVWFRGFMSVLDDSAVGGSGSGSGSGDQGGEGGGWGSRPPRLLRVIEQRAGCAQEAVQLFVALCRGLGLRARYVACLDPIPPTPSAGANQQRVPSRPSKPTKRNTVDLVAGERRQQQQQQRRGRGRGRGQEESSCFQPARLGRTGSSQAWAEVLCRHGVELHVVADEEETSPSKLLSPPKPQTQSRTHAEPEPARSTQHLLKRRRPAAPSPPPPSPRHPKTRHSGKRARAAVSKAEPLSPNNHSISDEDVCQVAVLEHSGDGSGVAREVRGRSRSGTDKPPQPRRGPKRNESSHSKAGRHGAGAAVAGAVSGGKGASRAGAGARARPPTRSGSKGKAAAVPNGEEPSLCGRPTRDDGSEQEAGPAAEKESSKCARENGRTSPVGSIKGAAGAGEDSGGSKAATAAVAAGGADGVESSTSGGVESRVRVGRKSKHADGAAEGSTSSAARDVRERWVHVDPIQGAVDQPEKVQDLQFRKRLTPYVVAEDGNQLIVDVTRRYTSEWARTLRTRGRAMASPDGWWNRALRLWREGAVANRRRNIRRKAGTGTANNPVLVGEEEEEEADANMDDARQSEEKELQEKVNSEPLPSTIAALKNHHVYVLGKNLLKFEGLRPGAKAVGLVKGCKVYFHTDVAKLRGASRWKKDALQVKKSEIDKPAKLTTKKGEKEGEGTSKLYGDWQTEPWAPEAAANGKVPKNEYGNVEFFDCSPAFLPRGTEHVQGDQIGRVAARLGIDYAPALTGFETKQGRQVPVLDGIIVCEEHSQMLRDAHVAWQQTMVEKQVKARSQRVLRRWRTLFRGVLLGAQLLEEYGSHD